MFAEVCSPFYCKLRLKKICNIKNYNSIKVLQNCCNSFVKYMIN